MTVGNERFVGHGGRSREQELQPLAQSVSHVRAKEGFVGRAESMNDLRRRGTI
jgi:hypothetical protein